MEIRDSIQSIKEFSTIGVDSIKEISRDAYNLGRISLSRVLDKIDTKLANAINTPEDEI